MTYELTFRSSSNYKMISKFILAMVVKPIALFVVDLLSYHLQCVHFLCYQGSKYAFFFVLDCFEVHFGLVSPLYVDIYVLT